MSKTKKNILSLVVLLAFSLIIRILVSYFSKGFQSDINTFWGWAENIYNMGVKGFYVSDIPYDYPPGFMFILWISGAAIDIIRNTVTDYYSLSVLVLKLPAIVCDILTAILIYRISSEKNKHGISLIIASLYLFNPCVVLNSSAWGQVDSILAFMSLLTIYLIYKDKMCFSYFTFCVGFLLKPQIIFISPIILLGIIDNVFLKGFSVKKMLINLACGIGAISMSLLLCVPFNLSAVIEQYSATMSSYPYATLNAYNFWAMLGLNWHFQLVEGLFGLTYRTWGYIFIAIICVIISFIWIMGHKEKKSSSNIYFFLTALLIISVFTFSVRMHERYMFPALALILAFCAVKKKIIFYILYFLASVIHFVNVNHIYWHYYSNKYSEYDRLEVLCGTAMVACFVFMIYLSIQLIITNLKLKKSKS